MKWITILIAAVALIACGEDSKKTGSETHWLSCETTADCNEGFVCSAGRCLPEDEVNNGTTGTNNATANASTNNTTAGTNNGGTNNTTDTNGGTNNTNGVCPLTAEPIPVPVDAVHDVTFELTNNYATDIWIPEQGWFCDPWTVTGVARQIGFRCGCECPDPGSPGVETLRRIAVDQTISLSWDGRGLVTYQECIDCADGSEPLYETAAVLQPVSGGNYEFRVAIVIDVPPAECTDNGDGTATCSLPGDQGLPPAIAESCSVPAAATETAVMFTLPASGSLTVPVSLP